MGRTIAGYCDVEEKERNPDNLMYLGRETNKPVLSKLRDYECFVAIGNNQNRERVCKFLIVNGINLMNAIHPSAIISDSVEFGEGIMVGPGAVINAHTKIQDGAICNTNSVIEHDCNIGAYCHVSPGTVLCGAVVIGDTTLIGAGAVVILYVNIGSNVVVGAGTVVIKDIGSNMKVVGNPQTNI
jgi:sugar O-acyltransferase (sialic acid O-acetyltransferase NeuD family)